jgi:hypothetical protein
MGCGGDDECRNEKSNEFHAHQALDHKECAPLKNIKQRFCENTPPHGFYGVNRPQGMHLIAGDFLAANDRWRATGAKHASWHAISHHRSRQCRLESENLSCQKLSRAFSLPVVARWY